MIVDRAHVAVEEAGDSSLVEIIGSHVGVVLAPGSGGSLRLDM
jgi:hypothetical protein